MVEGRRVLQHSGCKNSEGMNLWPSSQTAAAEGLPRLPAFRDARLSSRIKSASVVSLTANLCDLCHPLFLGAT